TAKESLVSLLKANDCETKDMILNGNYYHAYFQLDEIGHTVQRDITLRWEENKDSVKKSVYVKPIDDYPDDFLIVKIQ
ncbi:MAG: hypothetical protein ACYC5G_05250, partial [Candidatus Doudnabacteria bacterium]